MWHWGNRSDETTNFLNYGLFCQIEHYIAIVQTPFQKRIAYVQALFPAFQFHSLIVIPSRQTVGEVCQTGDISLC